MNYVGVPDLMQNPQYVRTLYNQQQPMYPQNQPLPPGPLCQIHPAQFAACKTKPQTHLSHRRSRFRTTLQTLPPAEQNDAAAAKLPRHDAWHASEHAWYNRDGKAVPGKL